MRSRLARPIVERWSHGIVWPRSGRRRSSRIRATSPSACGVTTAAKRSSCIARSISTGSRPETGDGDYFLVVSRLLALQAVDLAIEAAAWPACAYSSSGSGPAERRNSKRLRAGTRTEFLGAFPTPN
jgi:hypothetical protein